MTKDWKLQDGKKKFTTLLHFDITDPYYNHDGGQTPYKYFSG